MPEENESIPRRIQKIDLKAQVEEELIRYIKQMKLGISTKLPREEELSKMLGVSRITLRSVLDDLSSKGMIFRKHGKGTFVNREYFEVKASFNPVMHFSDMITNSGYTPKIELLDYKIIKASEDTAKQLGIKKQDKVLQCDKIFYADKQICAVTRDFISLSYLGETPVENLEKNIDSIFYFMYKVTGKKLVLDKVELNAVYSKEVKLLNEILERQKIPPRAFLCLKGVNYDEDERPAVETWEYVDTTILKYTQFRKRILHYENIT